MISKRSCKNLNEQGFSFLSIEEKNKLNKALRITPSICITLVIIGLYYQSVEIFFILSIFGILGTITSNKQPIDFLYNIIAKLLKLPQLPPNPAQKRFACAVGSFFLIGATVSFYFNNMLWGYIFGISYILAAGIMATTHFCIASWVYNRV